MTSTDETIIKYIGRAKEIFQSFYGFEPTKEEFFILSEIIKMIQQEEKEKEK
jgi:hypothetical protein